MKTLKDLISILLFACVLLSIAFATTKCCAQAFCALRDPTARIYELYPEASSYRSLVRTISEDTRQYVGSKLPFTIHFNELGRHTLYLPVKEKQPLGLVHARSEAGAWGLTEIVWSLSPDLVVQNFEFQRCRSRKRTAVENRAFKEQIIGKAFNQLQKLLTPRGDALAQNGVKVDPAAREVAVNVIRSALKTITVTQYAWSNELKVIQPLYHVHSAFAETHRIEQVSQPYSQSVKDAVRKLFGADAKTGVNQQQVQMFKGFHANGQVSGYVIRTPWQMQQMRLDLWWYVNPDGEITAVKSQGGWPEKDTAKAFEDIPGMKFEKLENCSAAAELAGAEVMLLVKANANGSQAKP